jgi:fatty acid desaturase
MTRSWPGRAAAVAGCAHAGGVIDPREMRVLGSELAAAGVFRHHEAATWAKLGLLLVGLAACLVAIASAGGWIAVALVPVAAVLTTTAAMLGHEGSHRSFSASAWRNRLIQHLTFPLLSGLGALYWHHKHDGLHHGHPNVRGGDPDLDLWPMVSCREDHETSSPALRWWQRNFQGAAFWPLTTLLPVVMRIPSLTHLVGVARRRGVDAAWAADATCLALHYTLWLVIPSLVWGVLPALALYMGLWAIVGVMLALIFAPAHIGLPVVAGQHRDWLHQFETTRNLRVPRWLSWFFVGLEYQIEHHLYPRIAHQEMGRAAAIVEAWSLRVGAPYRRIGYGAAIVDVTRFMRGAWQHPAEDRDVVRARSAA